MKWITGRRGLALREAPAENAADGDGRLAGRADQVSSTDGSSSSMDGLELPGG